MYQSGLEKELEIVISEAQTSGLATFSSNNLSERFFETEWQGDWKSYLAVALRLQIPILYVQKEYCDLANLLGINSTRPTSSQLAITDEIAEDEDDLSAAQEAMLTQWKECSDKLFRFTCTWIKDDIAHLFVSAASWYTKMTEELEFLSCETQSEEYPLPARRETPADILANQRAELEEERKRIQELAEQMTQHPRYCQATSEAKRLFMAQQLYQEEALHVCKRIAETASSYSWWNATSETKRKTQTAIEF